VEGCLLTFNYLVASIEALLEGSGLRNSSGNSRELRAYRIGCAKRLLTMVSDLKRKRIDHGGSAAEALVHLGLETAKKHISSLNLKGGLPHDTRVHASSVDAYQQGFEDGGRIDIHGARSTRMLK